LDYWINASGEAKGPYTYRQLLSMWSCGTLTADTSYYDAISSVWKPLKLILESGLPPIPESYVQLPPLPIHPADQKIKNILLECSEERKSSSPPEKMIETEKPHSNNNIFTFTGRWNRRTYFIIITAYGLAFGPLLYWAVTWNNPNNDPQNLAGGVYLIFFLWAYLAMCAAVKRMHDINWPAWGVIVLPAMFTWLFLGLVGGNKFENNYGPPPKSQFL